MIDKISESFLSVIPEDVFLKSIKIIIFISLALIILKILKIIIRKTTSRYFSDQTNMLIQKVFFYSGLVIIFLTLLNYLGVSIAAILGAAGIAGIAIGFAAQTSISNIISGLFLISENTFEVGNLIQSGSTTGTVMSIDLLSIKIRTLDNRLVRIPNESIIKNELINITRFPIRRVDINISVAYKEKVEKVREVLFDIAKKNPYSLDNPEPLFLFKAFGESGLDILFGIWISKTDYLELKNSIMIEIKNRFEEEKIEIPFPHVSLYAGEATKPFPVEISKGE